MTIIVAILQAVLLVAFAPLFTTMIWPSFGDVAKSKKVGAASFLA